MDIIFNRTVVDSIIFKNEDINQYSFVIKEELIKMNNYNIIEFISKYHFNPLSMGISSDTRNLSVFITKITIEKQ
jgi:hypothetical protein